MTPTPGSVVILKSGGPAMTVISLNRNDGLVVCRWFGGENELREEAFGPEELHIVCGDLSR